jgi:small basic protein
LIAIVGLLLGVILGIFINPDVPSWLLPYLPIAVVAALDAVFGGIRANLEKVFDDQVFIISFLSNVLLASLIVFLGDQLGVGSQLSTGVVVVLAMRIFANAAAIRRLFFKL